MSGRRTVAVIPNWNGAGRLERCLASLQAQRGAAAELVVVDNASADGSAEAAERAGARVLRFAENRGFAAAVNRGVSESESELVAVINNDVELDAEWLARLEAALDRHPECGMVTGRTLLRARPGILDGAGDALALGLAAARLGHGQPDGPAWRQARPVLAVSGAASLFRREVFRRVGGFEEAFFAYLEDVEFCLRAQLAGFQARYVPEAVAWHEVGASLVGQAFLPVGEDRALHPRVVTWMTAHQLLLVARYARRGALRAVLPRAVVVQALWAARMLLAGRPLAWLRGLLVACARWRRLRRWNFPPGAGPERLLELLAASEAQIYADRGERDTFWRIYFRLFPPAREASLLAPAKTSARHSARN